MFIKKVARKLSGGNVSWVVEALTRMRVNKADMDALMEMFPTDVFIPSKTKAKFTREYKSLNM